MIRLSVNNQQLASHYCMTHIVGHSQLSVPLFMGFLPIWHCALQLWLLYYTVCKTLMKYGCLSWCKCIGVSCIETNSTFIILLFSCIQHWINNYKRSHDHSLTDQDVTPALKKRKLKETSTNNLFAKISINQVCQAKINI